MHSRPSSSATGAVSVKLSRHRSTRSSSPLLLQKRRCVPQPLLFLERSVRHFLQFTLRTRLESCCSLVAEPSSPSMEIRVDDLLGANEARKPSEHSDCDRLITHHGQFGPRGQRIGAKRTLPRRRWRRVPGSKDPRGEHWYATGRTDPRTSPQARTRSKKVDGMTRGPTSGTTRPRSPPLMPVAS